jgi:hypothetical protein
MSKVDNSAFSAPAHRVRFAINTDPTGDRARRKQAIRSIHIKDEAWMGAETAFKMLLNRLEDGAESFALVIHAPSGAGKTHIIEHLAADERVQPFTDEYGEVRPLLRVSTPSPCTLKSLGIAIYRALTGKSLPEKLPKHDIWVRVRTTLFNMGVSILMLDELHHLFDNASTEAKNEVISTLKSLLIGVEADEDAATLGKLPPTVGVTPIGLVLSGMPYLKSLIALDLQLQRRCKFHPLERLSLIGNEADRFKGFVERFEKRLGLTTSPELISPDMLLRLHKATNGYRGRAAFLIKEAAYLAIDQGQQNIDRAKHFARVFERIYKVGDVLNPFLVADPTKIKPIPESERPDKSLLRGSKKMNPLD